MRVAALLGGGMVVGPVALARTFPAETGALCDNLTMQSVNLTNHFLIAMPNMADPYFQRSLTYICEHNENGALGIVVNRPIDLTMEGLFEQIGIELNRDDLAEMPVYFGGPVQMETRARVLHAHMIMI